MTKTKSKTAFPLPARFSRPAALRPDQERSNRLLFVLARDIRAIRRLERDGRWQEAARATSDVRAKAVTHDLTAEVDQLLFDGDGPRYRSASQSLRRWW